MGLAATRANLFSSLAFFIESSDVKLDNILWFYCGYFVGGTLLFFPSVSSKCATVVSQKCYNKMCKNRRFVAQHAKHYDILFLAFFLGKVMI